MKAPAPIFVIPKLKVEGLGLSDLVNDEIS